MSAEMEIDIQTIYFAGGCFWGVEEYFRRVSGVLESSSGYMGGHVENPDYYAVCDGDTGHAETVKVVFDKNVLSYQEILGRFFSIHDPTSLNRQGNDVGSQYRSAIFYTNNEQKKEIDSMIAHLTHIKKFYDPIVTEVFEAKEFYLAEEHHQRYLEKRPFGYCHVNLKDATKPIDERYYY